MCVFTFRDLMGHRLDFSAALGGRRVAMEVRDGYANHVDERVNRLGRREDGERVMRLNGDKFEIHHEAFRLALSMVIARP